LTTTTPTSTRRQRRPGYVANTETPQTAKNKWTLGRRFCGWCGEAGSLPLAYGAVVITDGFGGVSVEVLQDPREKKPTGCGTGRRNEAQTQGLSGSRDSHGRSLRYSTSFFARMTVSPRRPVSPAILRQFESATETNAFAAEDSIVPPCPCVDAAGRHIGEG